MKKLLALAGVAALGCAIIPSASPRVGFDLRATPNADGTRSAKVAIAGRRTALPDGATAVRSAAVTPDGKYALVVHGLGRYNLPATQLDRGWINASAVSVLDAETGRLVNTVLLDDPTLGAANPRAIAVNDRLIAIAHFGTHELSVIDAPRFFDRLRSYDGDASTDLSFMRSVGRRRYRFRGKGPETVGFLPDGRIAVTFRFTGNRATVDPATGAVEETEPREPADPVRRGEMHFNDATLCFQQWQSCASCHVDGANDGLRWDFPNSGGGLGHPEETVNLTELRELSATCVPNSFRDDHLHAAPAATVAEVEAYIRSISGAK